MQRDELFRPGIVEWLQEHAVYDAEDGGVGAYSYGDGQQSNRGEHRIAAKHAQSVANIGEEIFDGGPAPYVAAVLFRERYISKFAASGGRGFSFGHAVGDKILDPFLEVLLNLGGKIVLETAARKKLFEQIHDSPGAKLIRNGFEHPLGPSLATQRDNRIDLRRPACGNITGYQSHCHQQQGHGNESGWVYLARSEQ